MKNHGNEQTCLFSCLGCECSYYVDFQRRHRRNSSASDKGPQHRSRARVIR